jgi:hypothetical protein
MMGHGPIVAGARWTERRRSLFYPALMSVGMGMLASCAEKPPSPAPHAVTMLPPTPPPAPPTPPPRILPVPARKPVPPPLNNSSQPAVTEADTAGPDTAEPAMAMAGPEAQMHVPDAVTPPPPQETQLIGLDQPGATRLFGAATEQSEAPPAAVWRYRNAGCELDLFFYLDLRSGKMRALHYTFKGDAGDPAQRQDCLRSLVVARGN